jgi:hypothetical protein
MEHFDIILLSVSLIIVFLSSFKRNDQSIETTQLQSIDLKN